MIQKEKQKDNSAMVFFRINYFLSKHEFLLLQIFGIVRPSVERQRLISVRCMLFEVEQKSPAKLPNRIKALLNCSLNIALLWC